MVNLSKVIIEQYDGFLWRTIVNKAQKYRISTKIKVLRHENLSQNSMVSEDIFIP